MARWSYLLLASLTVLGVHAESAVLDLIPKNFDDVVLKSGKPGLVEFFAPWCGHCKSLAPVYEELAQAFAHASEKVHISKVNADEHKGLGERFDVQGYPTLKWFDGTSNKPEEYNGPRQFDDLARFITKKTGIRPKVVKEATHVTLLNDKTFYDEIGGNRDVFVAFTAPWCGHCQALAPIWEKLAEGFNREPNVLVAKVDVEAGNSKVVGNQERISSFPTIRFYPRKSIEPKTYSGQRTEEAFVKYLNKNSGTNRAPGGGLNAKAGTIEALNDLVEKYISGQTIAKVAHDITKAAKKLEDKYAAYYVKAATKMTESHDYALTELARLEKILGEGNLLPEKRDDLQSRSNILRRFLGIRPQEPDEPETEENAEKKADRKDEL